MEHVSESIRRQRQLMGDLEALAQDINDQRTIEISRNMLTRRESM